MAQEIMDFVTVGDLITYVNETPFHPTNVDGRLSSRNGRQSFTMTKDFPEACKLARDGWPEGLELLTEKLDLCLGKGKSRYRINDVAGDYPDIGRFLAGVPDSMSRRIINDSLKRPIIDIVLNVSYPGITKADRIMNYGAAITSIVDELETSGFRVNLKIGLFSKANGTRITKGCMVTVKTASESMDLDRMVYFIAHPSFFRRIGFGYFEIAMNSSELGSGYGHVVDMDTKDLEPNTIFFPATMNLNTYCSSLERAREYVKGIIRGSRPDLFDDVQEAA